MGIRKRLKDFKDWCPQPPSRLPIKLRSHTVPIAVVCAAALVLGVFFMLPSSHLLPSQPITQPPPAKTPTGNPPTAASPAPTHTPTASPPVTESPESPTPTSSPKFVVTPLPLISGSFSALDPKSNGAPGYAGTYNVSQGASLKVNWTIRSESGQPLSIPIENLSVAYYNSTVNLGHSVYTANDYSTLQEAALSYSFSLSPITLQPAATASTILTINVASNAPTGQYSLQITQSINIVNANGSTTLQYHEQSGIQMIVYQC